MTSPSYPSTRSLLGSGTRRLFRAWPWALLQLAGVPLLIACGIIWTRIPEAHAYQVAITLLLPVVIAAAFLALQAATVRALLRPRAAEAEDVSPQRSHRAVSLAWGAATLLLWIVIGWLLWILLDRFDAHIYDWAGYLNSRFGAGARASRFTFTHLLTWLGYAAWLLRWVVVPGLLIPLSCSALFGLRHAPWPRIARVWTSWRWWPAVLALGLLGEVWPQTFFDAQPTGTVRAQVWRVSLKLAATIVLAIVCWLVALDWCATLIAERGPANRAAPADAGEAVPLQGRPLPIGGVEGEVGGNA